MRFMGDPVSPAMTPLAFDPAVKAQLMIQARTLPDDKAHDLLDIADATPYGGHQKLIRIGVGAGVGLLVGLLAGKVFRKKR